MRYLAALWFAAAACLALGAALASLMDPPRIVVVARAPVPPRGPDALDLYQSDPRHVDEDYTWASGSSAWGSGIDCTSYDLGEPARTWANTCEPLIDGGMICYTGELPSNCKRTPEGLDCPTPESAR